MAGEPLQFRHPYSFATLSFASLSFAALAGIIFRTRPSRSLGHSPAYISSARRRNKRAATWTRPQAKPSMCSAVAAS